MSCELMKRQQGHNKHGHRHTHTHTHTHQHCWLALGLPWPSSGAAAGCGAGAGAGSPWEHKERRGPGPLLLVRVRCCWRRRDPGDEGARGAGAARPGIAQRGVRGPGSWTAASAHTSQRQRQRQSSPPQRAATLSGKSTPPIRCSCPAI